MTFLDLTVEWLIFPFKVPPRQISITVDFSAASSAVVISAALVVILMQINVNKTVILHAITPPHYLVRMSLIRFIGALTKDT